MTEITLRSNLDAMYTVFLARVRILSRYRGWFLMDIILPIFLAAMPILLGRAVAGTSMEGNFLKNVGTANYVAYMVIGANLFMVVSNSLWLFGFWLRNEMQMGTLESLYLAPVNKILILGGVALYTTLRSLISFFLAFTLGCFIFRVNPFQGDIGIAFLFLLVGLIPVYGLSFLYGSLVLKLKEAGALINIGQWVIGFLMGIFFPVTIFPRILRFIAEIFPPTWMNNGVRSALLGLNYFLGEWYLDLAVLWAFCIIMPLAGYYVFISIEKSIKKNEGVGKF